MLNLADQVVSNLNDNQIKNVFSNILLKSQERESLRKHRHIYKTDTKREQIKNTKCEQQKAKEESREAKPWVGQTEQLTLKLVPCIMLEQSDQDYTTHYRRNVLNTTQDENMFQQRKPRRAAISTTDSDGNNSSSNSLP